MEKSHPPPPNLMEINFDVAAKGKFLLLQLFTEALLGKLYMPGHKTAHSTLIFLKGRFHQAGLALGGTMEKDQDEVIFEDDSLLAIRD